MTGYGRTKGTVKGYQVDVEIRTLNSKFLDVQLKVPRLFQSKELEIRSLLSEGLTRGKLAVTIDMVQDAEADSSNQVNHELFKKYYKEFEALAQEVNANQSDLFRLALHSPDVMNGSALDEEELEEQWKGVKKLLAEAIVSCNNFRQQEGASLAAELAHYIDSIGSFLEQVKALDPERAEAIRERILKHQKEIESSDEFDKNRFEQEMIYYIEKLDISEELVRLSNHLSYFKEVMGESDSQGKKLGFISQEIGREINTIGSKANYAPIQKLVVGMKDELEKIKEQLLNII